MKRKAGTWVVVPFALPTSVFPKKSICSNKTVGPDIQTCIKSLNCQTGKHRLTPANRSRTHTQGVGQSRLFINNFRREFTPAHTLACHPSVNKTEKCCLLSYPILHFWELPKTLEKQFNKKLLYYIKLLESPISHFLQWTEYKITENRLQGVSKTRTFFLEKK